MLFPIIRIKDTDNGREHIVGTDTHDSLYINGNGRIAYTNLQNGGGLDDWYEFVGSQSEYSAFPVVEFVTFEGLMKLYSKQESAREERLKLRRKIAEAVFSREKED